MASGVSRGREGMVAASAALAVLWAPLVTILTEGPRGLAHYLAGDSLYYLTIARESRGLAFFSADGELATNGFHPLWQFVLSAVAAVFDPGPEASAAFALGLGCAFAAAGMALFAAALLHASDRDGHGGRAVLAVLAAVPGAYWLFWGRPQPDLLSPWSFLNGLETPLSALCFGGLAFAVVARDALWNPTRVRLLGVSALLAATLLARLDDVFLVGAFVGWAALRTPGDARERLARALWLGALPALALAAWLAYCQVTVGTMIPLSGAAKASGLVNGFLRNGYAVLTTFLPIADLLRPGGLWLWEEEATRVVQMLVPAVAAIAFLWIARPFAAARGVRLGDSVDPIATRDAYQGEIAGLLCCYVLAKVAYNFGWVGLYHQGHWYFPLAFLTVDLLFVRATSRVLERLDVPRTGWIRWTAPLAAALLIALSASVHAARKASAAPFAIPLRVFDQRADLQRALDARCPDCGILSFDDSAFAFSLRNRVVNGLGLAADLELARAARRGALLHEASRRGLRLITTASYPFGAAPGDDPDTTEAKLRAYYNLEGQNLDGFRFELLFVHEGTGAAFVHFAPIDGLR